MIALKFRRAGSFKREQAAINTTATISGEIISTAVSRIVACIVKLSPDGNKAVPGLVCLEGFSPS
jgi:hypothetical protein